MFLVEKDGACWSMWHKFSAINCYNFVLGIKEQQTLQNLMVQLMYQSLIYGCFYYAVNFAPWGNPAHKWCVITDRGCVPLNQVIQLKTDLFDNVWSGSFTHLLFDLVHLHIFYISVFSFYLTCGIELICSIRLIQFITSMVRLTM